MVSGVAFGFAGLYPRDMTPPRLSTKRNVLSRKRYTIPVGLH